MLKNSGAVVKLKELGYAFNAEGRLRKICKDTGEPGEEPFDFKVSDNDAANQEHYEQIANQITEIVYELMEQQGLARRYIFGDAASNQFSFVFIQPATLKRSKKLLVLIHGSGFVRAGQWSRRLIINNSINEGSQLPYIRRARQLGYDVLVLNTNQKVGGIGYTLGLNTPSGHASYAWRNIILASQPEAVAIVAHSMGGSIVMRLAAEFSEFFEEHVFAIATTDSASRNVPPCARERMPQIAQNWVASEKPLETPLASETSNVLPCVSAGHKEHDWIPHASFHSIFRFLERKYKDFQAKK